MLSLYPATPQDVPLILACIRELAECGARSPGGGEVLAKLAEGDLTTRRTREHEGKSAPS